MLCQIDHGDPHAPMDGTAPAYRSPSFVPFRRSMGIVREFGVVASFVLVLCGCRKAEPLASSTMQRIVTYDFNTYNAELLPSGGYVLQCMDRQDGRLSFAQFLTSNGEMAGRIQYSMLPRTIDGTTFTEGSILIRDLVPLANGNYSILGAGLDTMENGTVALHLLVYTVDRNGNQMAEPLRRPVNTISSVQYARSFTDDTVAIVKPHILGVELANNDIAAAVVFRMSDAPNDSIVLFRIPFGISGAPASRIAFGPQTGNLEGGQDRLWEFQSHGTQSEHLLLLSGRNDPVLTEFDFGSSAITSVASGRLFGGNRMISHFLAQEGDDILAGGIYYRPTATGSDACPFFSAITDVATLGDPDQYFFLDTLGPLDSPIQCFDGTWWSGNVALVTNTYRPQAATFTVDLFDYFNDTENDLGLLLVSPADGRILKQTTIVSGRGMRATNLFNADGRLICIGVQNAFYNSEAKRTFFLELKDPGQ